MTSTLQVRGRAIGRDEPLFVVAEIGLNHGGDVGRAAALVDAAAASGASAVKLQTLEAARLVAPNCPAPVHLRVSSLREFFQRFELDEAAHRALAERAHGQGLAFLSTPFDESAVDLLIHVGVDALKIASGDLTHHRLIARAARSGLPLFLSTGMSSLGEVRAAVDCARSHGAASVCLLHCVSAYPVPTGSENLLAIRTLARQFDVPVGLSDHGRDPLAVPLAVALGASVFERHVMLEDDGAAVDADVSASPAALRTLVEAAARCRLMLGHGRRECLAAEAPNRTASRRGVYAARALSAGARVLDEDIICLRPVHDIPAERWQAVVGCRVSRDVPAGHPLTPQLLEGYQDQ